MNGRGQDAIAQALRALEELSAQGPGGDAAGWERIAQQIEADARRQEALGEAGVDLRGDATRLLAALQVLRARLQALRDAAAAARRAGGAG